MVTWILREIGNESYQCGPWGEAMLNA